MPRNAAGSRLPLWTEAKNCLSLMKNGCFREAKFQRPLSGSELEQLAGVSRPKAALELTPNRSLTQPVVFKLCIPEADVGGEPMAARSRRWRQIGLS